jgi:hypothetical protein
MTHQAGTMGRIGASVAGHSHAGDRRRRRGVRQFREDERALIRGLPTLSHRTVPHPLVQPSPPDGSEPGRIRLEKLHRLSLGVPALSHDPRRLWRRSLALGCLQRARGRRGGWRDRQRGMHRLAWSVLKGRHRGFWHRCLSLRGRTVTWAGRAQLKCIVEDVRCLDDSDTDQHGDYGVLPAVLHHQVASVSYGTKPDVCVESVKGESVNYPTPYTVSVWRGAELCNRDVIQPANQNASAQQTAYGDALRRHFQRL